VRWSLWTPVRTPPPVPRATTGGAYRMYRSILGAHACLLLSLATFTALPLVGRIALDDPSVPQRAAISLVLLGVGIDVYRRGERLVHLGVLAVAFLVLAPTLVAQPVTNDSTVSMTLTAVGIMAARLMPMSRALALVGALGAVHVASLLLLDVPNTGLPFDAMVLVVATASAAIGFVNAMQASAIATERVREANRERELEITRAEAELVARTMSRRILHDDVLGTLHLLSDPIGPRERARQQCRGTAEVIRGVLADSDGPYDERDAGAGPDEDLTESWADLVAQLRASAPIGVEVVVVGRPQRLPALSEAQAAVLLRAAGEGVRNAARHGRVDGATVRMSADRDEIRVEVLDRGVGPGEAPSKGFGLRESVERPLAAVGGRSVLLPRPGGGAVLLLVVPRDHSGALDHAYGLTSGGLGPVQTLARTVAVPLTLAWCVIAAHSVIDHPSTWPSLVVCVGWILMAASIVRRMEGSGPDPRWVTTIVLATTAIQVVGIALLPEGAMLDFRSWSIGMSAVPLAVLVLSLPLPVGVAVLLLQVLVVVVAPEVRPDLSDGLFPWGSLNAVITAPVPALVLGTLIRRQGRALRRQRQRELALDQRRAVEEWRAATTDLYFAHVRDEVLPWLDDIADATIAPDAPDTVARARILASAARDDLYAPGFFDDALRDQVARFRTAGGTVELRAGLVPGGHQRTVGRVLRGLLPIAEGRRIIVTPPVAEQRQVRISVVPAPQAHALDRLRERAGPGFESDVDDYRAVLLVDDVPGSG
jgi:signal transduction histidine kinase